VSHLVVSTTKLEREDRLKVLPLEKDLAFESVGDVDGMCERCFFDDIVYPRCEDQAKVLCMVRQTFNIISEQIQTSGYPLGKRNSLGTLASSALGVDDGGDG
jgi:hypothetical protein